MTSTWQLCAQCLCVSLVAGVALANVGPAAGATGAGMAAGAPAGACGPELLEAMREISALANRIAYLSASVPALAANAAGNANQNNQATAALGKLAATLQQQQSKRNAGLIDTMYNMDQHHRLHQVGRR